MGELLKITDELCATCTYSYKTGMYKTHPYACDYLGVHGHSRTIENGEQRIQAGYCDCYKEHVGKRPMNGKEKLKLQDKATYKSYIRRREYRERLKNEQRGRI